MLLEMILKLQKQRAPGGGAGAGAGVGRTALGSLELIGMEMF